MEKPSAWAPYLPIPVTDFMLKMMTIKQEIPNFVELLDFSSVEFVEKEQRHIKLPGVDFSWFDFSNTDLTGGDFSSWNFLNCKLIGTDFSGCNLQDADFTKSQLSSCVFEGANLNNTNLRDADLGNVFFSNELGIEFPFVPPGKFTRGSAQREKHRDYYEFSQRVVLIGS